MSSRCGSTRRDSPATNFHAVPARIDRHMVWFSTGRGIKEQGSVLIDLKDEVHHLVPFSSVLGWVLVPDSDETAR